METLNFHYNDNLQHYMLLLVIAIYSNVIKNKATNKEKGKIIENKFNKNLLPID